jgi:signal transduction histidine kinase
MAEEFITRDQHRADLAELRLEIANSLASLDKRTELIAQELRSFQQQTQQNFMEVKTAIQELRSTIRDDTRRIDGKMDRIDNRIDIFTIGTQRQLWIIVGTVVFAVLTGVIKLVFFP